MQACTICGDTTHRSWECPKQKQELFVLPDAIKAKVGLGRCGGVNEHRRVLAERCSAVGARGIGPSQRSQGVFEPQVIPLGYSLSCICSSSTTVPCRWMSSTHVTWRACVAQGHSGPKTTTTPSFGCVPGAATGAGHACERTALPWWRRGKSGKLSAVRSLFILHHNP